MENVFGKAVVAKAMLYAEHEWHATEKNVLHGIDANGNYVDTPDITWKGEVLDCGWWKPNEKKILELHMDGEILRLSKNLIKELQRENMLEMFQRIHQDMEANMSLEWTVLVYLRYAGSYLKR